MAVEIHIKLRKWQISSLAASSIKNLPTCLSVLLSVSADFRSVVHQNDQSKTVSATWWHSGTIVQHGRCDQGNFYPQTWALAHLRFWGLHFCSHCGGADVLVIIGKHINHYFGVVCFVMAVEKLGQFFICTLELNLIKSILSKVAILLENPNSTCIMVWQSAHLHTPAFLGQKHISQYCIWYAWTHWYKYLCS